MTATPPPPESPALRLARYLKEFVGLRTTTVRDVSQYEAVHWFSDMPQENDCVSGAWTDEHDPAHPWLEVHKQNFERSPTLPDAILPWVDQAAFKRATPEIPALRSSIYLPDDKAVVAKGEARPLIKHSLDAHPEVTRAFAQFQPTWIAWSTEHRRRETVQKTYADLFALHTQIRKQGEIVEVVLGLGFIDWPTVLNGKSILIRRHAIAARVELDFDPTRGVIRVVPPGDGANIRIEDDMLEAELRPDRTHYAMLASQIEEVGDDIWDKAQMHTLLRSWAAALAADMQWSPALKAPIGNGSRATMTLAPALMLRKRAQAGMVRIYEALINQLAAASTNVPAGWGGLVDDVGDQPSDPIDHVAEPAGRDASPPSDTYFPLPANREQRRIAEAISRQRGVLVQGPPGTGKSHTIANLICHLLATGKRLLVTAETGRALQVLKEKLPLEIQPLCVSLLGQGGDAFAELNAAVTGITTRQASYSRAVYDDRIREIDKELDKARRLLAETDFELRSLREDEIAQHSLANGAYHGTASVIADVVATERERYQWLKLPRSARPEPPLSNSDLLAWLLIRRRYSPDDISTAVLLLPSSQSLPNPSDFASAVATEFSVKDELSRSADLRKHPAYVPIRALDIVSREQLQSDLHSLEGMRLALGQIEDDWRLSAVRDLIRGRKARWETILSLSRDRTSEIDALFLRLGNHEVVLPSGYDSRRIRSDAEAAINYFATGGTWKRLLFLTPKELNGRQYLKERTLVDGAGADNSEQLRLLCDYLDLEFALNDLCSAWGAIGAAPTAADRRVRFAELKELSAILERCCTYADACQRLALTMAAASTPIPPPNWETGEAGTWLTLLGVAVVEDRLQNATQVVTASLRVAATLRNLHNSHPVVRVLTEAIVARDIKSYSQCYECIIATEAIRADQERRAVIEKVLAETAPNVTESIVSSLNDDVWDIRLSEWENAWRWGVADAWLEKRSDFDYQQELWSRRPAIEHAIGDLTSRAAALRAWSHFFDRLSHREAAALKSWREAVRAMGKGTGRSAKMARLRLEARRYMDSCRDAIPVWIMPRYLVAEMIDPAPGRYDLVIVDEASQLGIESLFLFYIAKKLVVVGDDQQISPMGVGISDEAIAGLQNHYLEGIPHHHALSAQSSLYGNAKIRFSQNIVLREHFRCMPEIIQFSNDLCYANNGTPLDPLRAYPANRLKPLVLRHVADGYRVGSPQNAQNPAEADAIVAQIAACVADPRYSGLTMGVISLQGEAQARLIERKLLDRLEPEVIEDRRLICGDAYAFQGDERNIMFLSMVAAPGESRIGALATESARQRFNVAVSRAQDQLWLFHTATLDVLSETCMRHRLLSYMLDPVRKATSEAEQCFESKFERDVFRVITERGFHVRTQVSVGDPTNHKYRIDLVVEGMQGRLAVECDGDVWHGPERYEYDMSRQRDLERAGWRFSRVRGSDYYRDPSRAMVPVWAELERLGIRPGGVDVAAAEPPAPLSTETAGSIQGSVSSDAGVRSEVVVVDSTSVVASDSHQALLSFGASSGERFRKLPEVDTKSQSAVSRADASAHGEAPERLPLLLARAPYVPYQGVTGHDPRYAPAATVSDGLVRIITVEGPVVARRAYDIYLRGSGVHRMGGELKRMMDNALQLAVTAGRIVQEDEAGTGDPVDAVVRLAGCKAISVRERGPRVLEEIPPSELQFVARRLATAIGTEPGSDAHLRAVLDFFDLKRLTVQAGTAILNALGRHYPYVDDAIGRDP